MDNLATHKTKTIRDWFARHPRWHVHFTPDIGLLVQPSRAFLRLAHRPAATPRRAPLDPGNSKLPFWIDAVNDDPRLFRWTKSAAVFPRNHPALLP